MNLPHSERVKICMRERGYIVLACNSPVPIGKVIWEVDSGTKNLGGPLPQPFAVTKQTDRTDAMEQMALLHKFGETGQLDDGWSYYYRVSTD